MDLADIKRRHGRDWASLQRMHGTDGAQRECPSILRDRGQLIAEVERLTALCDGYRGEVATLKAALDAAQQEIAAGDAEAASLHQKCIHAYGTAIVAERERDAALTRARAEGMEDTHAIVYAAMMDGNTEWSLDDVYAKITAALASEGGEDGPKLTALQKGRQEGLEEAAKMVDEWVGCDLLAAAIRERATKEVGNG